MHVWVSRRDAAQDSNPVSAFDLNSKVAELKVPI